MAQGEAFEIASFIEDRPIIPPTNDVKAVERPADKRSQMVDRQHAPQQVLCYICCSEFGTSSLPIHQKTCLKKHAWAIEANIVNAEGVSKKTAQKNKKLCSEPGSGPTLPIPNNHSPPEAFDAYNTEAQKIFFEHAEHCLLCRTRDEEYEKRRKAEEEARRRAEEEEARRKAEEAARLRAEEEARRKAEEDAKRRQEEEEAARRRAEEDARRRAEEDARKRAEDEARRKAEEDARRKAEEDARRRQEEEEAARRRAEEDARRRAEEEEAERQRREKEARQKAADEARKRIARAEWERIQRDLARKKAAEEDALIQAQLEEARRLAAEREEEERRRRQMAMGKRNFLRKGEGHIAAHEAGKVTQEREAEEKAKRDIAEYSLLHAKKGGLVKPSSSSSHTRPNIGSGNYEHQNSSQDDAGNGKRSRPVSGVKNSNEVVKNGVVYKEMDTKFDNNWDNAWTEEDEINFLKARNG